eukprot:632731-Prorocentrum_minimum.AAC.2
MMPMNQTRSTKVADTLEPATTRSRPIAQHAQLKFGASVFRAHGFTERHVNLKTPAVRANSPIGNRIRTVCSQASVAAASAALRLSRAAAASAAAAAALSALTLASTFAASASDLAIKLAAAWRSRSSRRSRATPARIASASSAATCQERSAAHKSKLPPGGRSRAAAHARG